MSKRQDRINRRIAIAEIKLIRDQRAQKAARAKDIDWKLSGQSLHGDARIARQIAKNNEAMAALAQTVLDELEE